ncbi:hypothetical protein IMY05_011G0047900 [Salix suchowensis]|nr:hypothetical protein IMY05_011G0047900 [Salix suchowensis]
MTGEVTPSFPVHPLFHIIHKHWHPRGIIMNMQVKLLVPLGYIQRPLDHTTYNQRRVVKCCTLCESTWQRSKPDTNPKIIKVRAFLTFKDPVML